MYRDPEGNAAVLAEMAIRFASMAEIHDAETLRATIVRLEHARGPLAANPGNDLDRADAAFLQAAIDRLALELAESD